MRVDAESERVDAELERVDAELKQDVTESLLSNSVGRRISTGDMGSNLDGSPNFRNTKRALNLSPSTPVGRQRKHQIPLKQCELQELTFGEDVIMLDVEQIDHEVEFVNTPSLKLPTIQNVMDSPRRILKGLRRTGSGNRSTSSPNRDLTPLKSELTLQAGAQNSVYKGISINSLKNKSKTKQNNYKTTRKKRKKVQPCIDNDERKSGTKQRLISEFYKMRINKTVAGPEPEVNSYKSN